MDFAIASAAVSAFRSEGVQLAEPAQCFDILID